MSKKLAFQIANNTGVCPQFALSFLRNASIYHSARMKNASTKKKKAQIHAHYVAWLQRVRYEKKLAYYGYGIGIHEYVR